MSTRKSFLGMIVLLLFAAIIWLTGDWYRQAQANDFTEYWAASQLLLQGRNPYAVGPVLEIERQTGFSGQSPLMMRNPPWTLPFVLPFGLLSYRTAQSLWLCLSLAAVLVSTHFLSRLYSTTGQPLWVAWLVAATFLPLATVLAIGQIGPLMLMGITGFLVCQLKQWEARAGACTLLIAIKPHLAFLFWPALLFWAIQWRRWRMLIGLAVALTTASAIPLALDPGVFSQYSELWTSSGIFNELVPTLGGVVRLLLNPATRWLAFAPTLAAVVWFLFYWWGNRQRWQWQEQMPLLLMASVTTTAFGWFFDHVVLLPAVLQAAAWMIASENRTRLWAAIAYFAINGLSLTLILNHRVTFWYVWVAPAWLLLYLWLRTKASVIPGNA